MLHCLSLVLIVEGVNKVTRLHVALRWGGLVAEAMTVESQPVGQHLCAHVRTSEPGHRHQGRTRPRTWPASVSLKSCVGRTLMTLMGHSDGLT